MKIGWRTGARGHDLKKNALALAFNCNKELNVINFFTQSNTVSISISLSLSFIFHSINEIANKLCNQLRCYRVSLKINQI